MSPHSIRPGRRAAAFLFALGLALGPWISACTPDGGADAGASPRPAPAFSLDRLGGGNVSLAELEGKTIVLDFWATWCPPCEFQVPELNRFYEAHREDSDVVVFGVSVDVEGADVVQAWVSEKQVHYPILLQGEDLARAFGAVGFPTLFVVSPEGNVLQSHVGLIEADDLEDALAESRSGGTSS
jgi:thiol-disulfide isomerase/thioredoxin